MQLLRLYADLILVLPVGPRRKRRANKKCAGRTKPTTYLAGGFGLSKHPEVDLNNEDIDNIEVDFSKEVDITFVDDSMSISIHNYV